MKWLEKRLGEQQPLIAPGAYDSLSAKMIELHGFDACYCSGFSLSVSSYGLPDLGLLGLEEVLAFYRRISRSISTPMIVDADTGYGGLLSLQRTITEFSSLGIKACHVEDQTFPKRCGHLNGKSVVNRELSIARIKLAVDTSSDTDLSIIARTDAIATEGFDEAILRANLFIEAGATAVFIDAPRSMEEIRTIPLEVNGPVLFNAAPIGAVQPTTDEIIELGYQIIIHPIESILAAANAVSSVLNMIKPSAKIGVIDFDQLNSIVETATYIQSEKLYTPQDNSKKEIL